MEEERFRLTDAAAAAAIADRAFASLRRRLGTVLPPGAGIEHVGATAVPGCETKGDLDLVVRVSAGEFAAADAALARLFPRNTGSVRTEDFSAFADEAYRPPLGVQLVVQGSALDDFTGFRDRLRAEPALVARYNALKRAHDGAPMDTYREAKAAFIDAVLNGA
ncbi:GrpB family protein [Methylobacterium sp. JK268]